MSSICFSHSVIWTDASSNVLTQIEYYVRKYNYRLSELEDRKDEIMKMLEIGDNVLDKNTYELSESELSKVLVGSVLLCNPSTIILDDMLYSFDYRTKERILKLFIKLKKFFKKTIILISSNIDDLYEYIDEIIIIDEGKVLLKGEKSIIYDNYDLLIKKNISNLFSILTDIIYFNFDFIFHYKYFNLNIMKIIFILHIYFY